MKALLMLAEWLLTPVLYLAMGLVLGGAMVPAALLLRWAFGVHFLVGVVAVGPAYFVFGLTLAASVVLVKWLFLYRAREGAWPFLCWQTARWAVVTKFHDMARFLFVDLLVGSRFLNLYFQGLGMRVGRNVVINATEISDWDLIELGDDTMIGAAAVIQAHVGEKGMLRMAPVRIGKGCTIGRDTIIMPGATVEDGGVLAALSVLSKGKIVPANTVWGGTELRQLAARGGRAAAVPGEEPGAPG